MQSLQTNKDLSYRLRSIADRIVHQARDISVKRDFIDRFICDDNRCWIRCNNIVEKLSRILETSPWQRKRLKTLTAGNAVTSESLAIEISVTDAKPWDSVQNDFPL